MDKIVPYIRFHLIEDKNNYVKSFNAELDFYPNKKIDLNKQLIIEDKFFTQLKDKFKNIYYFEY